MPPNPDAIEISIEQRKSVGTATLAGERKPYRRHRHSCQYREIKTSIKQRKRIMIKGFVTVLQELKGRWFFVHVVHQYASRIKGFDKGFFSICFFLSLFMCLSLSLTHDLVF